LVNMKRKRLEGLEEGNECLSIEFQKLKVKWEIMIKEKTESTGSLSPGMSSIKIRTLYEVVFSHHASHDVKVHAVYARLYAGLDLRTVGKAFGKSEATISRWVDQYDKEKERGLQKVHGDHHRVIHDHHKIWIENYVRKRPFSYLNEIQKAFKFSFHEVSISTIYRILVERGITKKVIEAHAMEIQTEDIFRFKLEMDKIFPFLHCQLLFLDEMSCDNRSMNRSKGWFKQSVPPVWNEFHPRSDKISILSYVACDRLIETDQVEGTFTWLLFFASVHSFIQKGFIEPYLGKKSVWILDDA
jgi:transposase